MRDIFSVSLVVVLDLLFFTRTHSKELQSNASTSTCKPDPHSGIPGMPGVPGIPGTPGFPGRDGFKGEKGIIGKRGSQGAVGIPGKIGLRGPEGLKGEMGKKGEVGKMGATGSTGIQGNTGPRGFKGSKGDKGPIGTKGSTGIPGNIGPRGLKGFKGVRGSMGTRGSKGIPGIIGPTGLKGSKGEKGHAGDMDPRQNANWKQCAWQSPTEIDNGKIKECSFNKLHGNTALRVSYQGNVRVHSDAKCNRWYFKFNGNECSGPMPIDSVIYNDWDGGIPNIIRQHSFHGYCENLARGTVSVELWVGKCSSVSLGDAYTGWKSVSRIIIEEVPPSQ